MQGERVYMSNLPIKYLFDEGSCINDHLVVIFSGFNDINSQIKHAYNYTRVLKTFNCNKLFILDNYGEYGCYYLGENLNYEVETSVLSLITHFIKKLNISHENVSLVGSSKGGSAALYFGLKYNFGNVIAGAFQTKISDYLKIRPETYNYLIGGNQQNHQLLNNIIYRQIEKEITTKLYLMSSKNDDQYTDHILPFLKALDDKEIPYIYYECEVMKNHSDIGNHFPAFLIKHLLSITHLTNLEEYRAEIEDDFKIKGDIRSNNFNATIKTAFTVKLLNKSIYERENSLEYIPDKPGFYSTFLTIYKENEIAYEEELMNKFIGAGQYQLKEVNFHVTNNTLRLSIDTNSHNLTYAFYILKDHSIVNKIMYQKNNFLNYEIDGKGLYQVQYYIKDEFGNIAVNKTSILKVE